MTDTAATITVPMKQKPVIGVNSLGEIYAGRIGCSLTELVLQDREILDNPEVADFVSRVHQFQNSVNDARFRVHGRRVGNRNHIGLVTELTYFVDDKDASDSVAKLNRESIKVDGYGTRNVFVEEMHTSPRVDRVGVGMKALSRDSTRSFMVGRIIDEIICDDKGDIYIKTHGPNHERLERRVEVYVCVTPLTDACQLESARDSLKELTQDLFKPHGVELL